MINVPFFKKEDWLKLRIVSLDSIPGSYEEYMDNLEQGLKAYNKNNEEVKRFSIDTDKLVEYLKLNNLPNVADNRAIYINEKISGLYCKRKLQPIFKKQLSPIS